MKFRLIEDLENKINYNKYINELKTISANDFIKVLGLKQSHEFRLHRPMFILHDGSLLESEQAIGDLYTDPNGYAHVDLLVAYVLRRAGVNRKISEKEFDEIYDLVWNLKSFTNKFNWIQVNSGTKYEENKPYISLGSEITDAQTRTLQDILWKLTECGYKQIEVWADDNNHNVYQLNSEAPEYIIHRIKQYFSFGKLYESTNNDIDDGLIAYNGSEKYFTHYSDDSKGKDIGTSNFDIPGIYFSSIKDLAKCYASGETSGVYTDDNGVDHDIYRKIDSGYLYTCKLNYKKPIVIDYNFKKDDEVNNYRNKVAKNIDQYKKEGYDIVLLLNIPYYDQDYTTITDYGNEYVVLDPSIINIINIERVNSYEV